MAILVGALTGTTLHYVSSHVFAALIVDPPRSTGLAVDTVSPAISGEEDEERRGRQRVKRARRKLLSPSNSSPLNNKPGDRDGVDEPRKGLIHNTILEEDDSSEIGF